MSTEFSTRSERKHTHKQTQTERQRQRQRQRQRDRELDKHTHTHTHTHTNSLTGRWFSTSILPFLCLSCYISSRLHLMSDEL